MSTFKLVLSMLVMLVACLIVLVPVVVMVPEMIGPIMASFTSYGAGIYVFMRAVGHAIEEEES